MPGVAVALGKWALSEAQTVTAHRAELRSSSPALLAALYSGTAGGPAPARAFTSDCGQDAGMSIPNCIEVADLIFLSEVFTLSSSDTDLREPSIHQRTVCYRVETASQIAADKYGSDANAHLIRLCPQSAPSCAFTPAQSR